jgi:chemotaxis protein methyltransferase CheR
MRPGEASLTCAEFLQWALPRLSLDWPGFRRVRRQVCHRVGRRVQELNLPDLFAYRSYLETHSDEWNVLDSFCWIPISRLLRDRIVFERLGSEVLPVLAAAVKDRGAREVHAWSAGCASGEEPYSLKILWNLEVASRFPDVSLTVVATDVDERLLERARRARYRSSSLRELPPAWLEKAITGSHDLVELRPEFRAGVEFRRADIRRETERGPFDLILCRNLVFTYFAAPLQRETLDRLLSELREGGALVIGLKERLPEGTTGVAGWEPRLKIYRRSTAGKAPP